MSPAPDEPAAGGSSAANAPAEEAGASEGSGEAAENADVPELPPGYELGVPTGEPILTVKGEIDSFNGVDEQTGEPVARFDLGMLEELGVTTIETSTHWTEGVNSFEGVLFSTLLEAVGADGSTVHAVALNDYAVDLAVAELRRYPVLLAYRRNGERMQVRDNGPIWVIYPRDDYPELQDEANNIKWIWQLKQLIVREEPPEGASQ